LSHVQTKYGNSLQISEVILLSPKYNFAQCRYSMSVKIKYYFNNGKTRVWNNSMKFV